MERNNVSRLKKRYCLSAVVLFSKKFYRKIIEIEGFFVFFSLGPSRSKKSFYLSYFCSFYGVLHASANFENFSKQYLPIDILHINIQLHTWQSCNTLYNIKTILS